MTAGHGIIVKSTTNGISSQLQVKTKYIFFSCNLDHWIVVCNEQAHKGTHHAVPTILFEDSMYVNHNMDLLLHERSDEAPKVLKQLSPFPELLFLIRTVRKK